MATHARQQIRQQVMDALKAVYPATSVFDSPRSAVKTLPSCVVWVQSEGIERQSKDEDATDRNVQLRTVRVVVGLLERSDMAALEAQAVLVEEVVMNLKQIHSGTYEYSMAGVTFSVSDPEAASEYFECLYAFDVQYRVHEGNPT